MASARITIEVPSSDEEAARRTRVTIDLTGGKVEVSTEKVDGGDAVIMEKVADAGASQPAATAPDAPAL